MKTRTRITYFLSALGLASMLAAAEPIVGGPKGGRLLETKPMKAEFFVTPERKAEIHFYDAAMKPTAPLAQTASVIAEPKSGRVVLELEKTETGFVSTAPLPASEAPYRVVVQVRPTPDATPQNFRVDLNLATCGECQRAEYACTCGHQSG